MAGMIVRQEHVPGLHGPLPELGTLVSLQAGDAACFSIDFAGNVKFSDVDPAELRKVAGGPLGAILTALCAEVARLRQELESVRSRVG